MPPTPQIILPGPPGPQIIVPGPGGPIRTILEKVRKTRPKPSPARLDPHIFRSIFGHLGPKRPHHLLCLAIPCRGSRSKLDFGPREAPSGPKPCFARPRFGAPRKISGAAKDFRRCEGFQAVRSNPCASGVAQFLFFSGKMHVLEKCDMPPWYVWSILGRF